jgi:hypothetical protein
MIAFWILRLASASDPFADCSNISDIQAAVDSSKADNTVNISVGFDSRSSCLVRTLEGVKAASGALGFDCDAIVTFQYYYPSALLQ